MCCRARSRNRPEHLPCTQFLMGAKIDARFVFYLRVKAETERTFDASGVSPLGVTSGLVLDGGEAARRPAQTKPSLWLARTLETGVHPGPLYARSPTQRVAGCIAGPVHWRPRRHSHSRVRCHRTTELAALSHKCTSALM